MSGMLRVVKTQRSSFHALPIAAFVAILTILAGCNRESPNAGPGFLPADQASPITMEIREYIETGGVVDVAFDLTGDVDYISGILDGLLDQVRAVDPDFAKIPFRSREFATALGLDGIGGFGLSSHPLDSVRFRNLSFVQIQGERRGLLKISGGAPAPFRILDMAEDSVDLAIEADLDFKSLNETLGNATEAAGGAIGRAGWTALAVTPIPGTPITTLDILNQLETRAFFVLDLDPSQSVRIPLEEGSIKIPSIHWVFHIEGLAPVLDKLRPQIDALPKLRIESLSDGFNLSLAESADLEHLRSRFGIDPTVRVNTTANTVTFASNPERASAFGNPRNPLGASAVWKKTAVGLPLDGNALTFINPETAGVIRDVVDQIETASVDPAVGMLTWQLGLLGLSDSGYAAVSQNLPDGLFTIANAESTHKPTIVSALMYNPLTVGLLSAMAIPAFQEVREKSRETAVLNNLRQISSASEQYFLEYGVDEVAIEKLIGPDAYIRDLESYAGESYDGLILRPGETISVTLGNGETVSYDPW